MTLTHDTHPRPFRWNVGRREQLGRLLDGPEAETYPAFVDDLRTLTAKVVARTAGENLVFVGRSVESVFDYLSGLFDTPPPIVSLFQFSAPRDTASDLRRRNPAEFATLLAHFETHGVDPRAILASASDTRFVDVVSTGWTFTHLFGCLEQFAEVQGADWSAVRRRIGFLGLTREGKTSPKTWRWHQHHEWVKALPRASVGNVSVPWRYWTLVANSEEKVTPSFDMWRWQQPDLDQPVRYAPYLMGLRLAVRLFDLGKSRDGRADFARALVALPEMDKPEVRSLVTRLRRGS